MAITAVDATLLPELRARHPLMVFNLRDLQDYSFTLQIERLPEGRDSAGHVIVSAMAVGVDGGLMAGGGASGGMMAGGGAYHHASAPPKEQVMAGGGGGSGLNAKLLG
jgi:hypothetical protein